MRSTCGGLFVAFGVGDGQGGLLYLIPTFRKKRNQALDGPKGLVITKKCDTGSAKPTARDTRTP